MNKISRHALAFNGGWFDQHQQKLLWLANHPLLSYWFRWVLRINGNRSAVGQQKITRINPEAIFWLLPNGALKAELRTHPKFGKRLYHAFKPLWWGLHFLDWLFIDRWIPEYSFGFATLTAYPQAGSGGGNTTVDGVVYTFLQSTWDLARTASPGDAVDTTGATGSVYVGSFGGSYGCTRYFATFDTSAIGSGGTISAATLSLYITSYASPPGSPQVNLIASTQAANNTLSTSDFQALGSTVFAQRAYDATSAGAYRAWTLNGSGLSAISKTGISKFAFLDDTYDVGGSDPGANEYEINFYMADRTGTTEDPKLEVTYSTTTILTPGAIGATTTIHSPTLAPGALAVAAGTIAAITSLFAPTLAQALPVGTITAGTQLHAPAFVAGNANVAAGTIAAATTAFYAPTLAPGTVTVAAGNIAATTSLHAPTLVASQTVSVGTITAGTVVRTPTVLGTSYHAFTFASGAEGLVDNAFSSDIDAYWEDGGDPAWRFSFDVPSTTDSEQGVKSPATGFTWQSLGVPDGAIVKSVQCTQYDDKVVNNSALASHSISIDLWDSGGSSVFTSGTLISGVSLPTTTSPSYTPQSGGSSLAVQSGKSSSTTDVRLMLEYVVTTNSGSVSVLYQIKNIDLAITYEFPASDQILAGTVNPATTIHAPSLSPGSVTLTPGAIGAGTSLYAPTLAGSTTLSPLAIGASTSLYAPTFAPAGTTLAPGAIGANTQIPAPTLAGSYALTPAAIAAATSLYAPTLAPGNTNVAAGAIGQGTQLFGPTLVGDSTISPSGVAATTQLYAPTFAPGGITVSAGAIAPATQLYAPALNQAIAVGSISAGTQFYAPVLQSGGATIQPGAIAAGSSLYAPTFASSATLTPGEIGATTALYAPTLAPGAVTVSAGTITAGSTLYAPSLAASNALTPGTIAAGTALHAPTLAAGNTNLPVGTIAPGTAFHTPALVGDGFISPAGIAATTSLYAPTPVPGSVTISVNAIGAGTNLYLPALSSIFILQPGSIAGTTTLYAPTLAPGSVTLTPGAIGAGTSIYAPTLAGTSTVLPGAIAAGTAVYAPTLAAGNTDIPVGTIAAGSNLYAPALVAGNANVSVGAIAEGTAFYAPTIVEGDAIAPTSIASSTTLHAPILAPGPVTVIVGTISASTVTYTASVIGSEAYLSLAVSLTFDLTLSVSLAFDLTLSVEVAGVPTSTIDIGDRVTVSATFVNAAEAAVDPSTVTFHQQTPDGIVTSYVYGTDAEAAKVSTGNYTFKYTATQAGTHTVRCVGTGTAIAAGKTTYQVETEF